MLQKLVNRIKSLLSQSPLHVLTTRQNVLIIQLYPKKEALSVSYKGKVKTGQFMDNSIRRMLKGGKHFEKDTFNVFGAVVRLLDQIIKENN